MIKSWQTFDFGFLGLLMSALLLPWASSAIQAQTVLSVTHTGDSGAGSLRQALLDANARAGTDTIVFEIPGAGPHAIRPLSRLPGIEDPVVLDGTTAPAYARAPVVELDGTDAGDAGGLVITADSATVRGLVINRFEGTGIWLLGSGATIEGNYIGTDVSGTRGLGNGGGGIVIDGSDNVIGGTTAGARNLISSSVNDGAGIEIHGEGATGNRIEGNFIGTDATGATSLGNTGMGIAVHAGAEGNAIGGTTAGTRNIISGNEGPGVWIGDADGNIVQGNYIGTDVSGAEELGNGRSGVEILRGSDNAIGGTAAGAGNVVSGNGFAGINIIGGNDNTVQGNFIGTDAYGTTAMQNNVVGVTVQQGAAGTLIGGIAARAGNVISGNGNGHEGGVTVISGARLTRVQGNFIGTDTTGTIDLGNRGPGVFVIGPTNENTIGGSVSRAGNTIAFNKGNGISVEAGIGTAILSNSLYANTGLGIDLGPAGVNANDFGDWDGGANKGQNFPVLKTVSSGRMVSGTLDSDPQTAYRIEFFASRACDAAGHGEGEAVLDSIYVTTDDSGHVDFTIALSDTLSAGGIITATATNPAGNTSEFCACLAVSEMEMLPDFTGIITTVAGGGAYGFQGDGGPATSAYISSPSGVFVDRANNLYITTGDARVRKVDPSGIITTVAGNGTHGYSGDGGPATRAGLYGPSGVFVDDAGNIYIVCQVSYRIRKVDPSGIITTVAGTGIPGYSGDGGPATQASFNGPRGIFVDVQGNLYIADTANHRIRKVDPSGIITTVAGTGIPGYSGDGGSATQAQLDGPWGVFVDAQDTLYIAAGYAVRKVDPSGIITTIAGNGIPGYSGDGGPATRAGLNFAASAVVDGQGDLYIADINNARIRKVDTFGTITTIAGNGERGYSGDGGPAIQAGLNFPTGVALDTAGNLYIADTNNDRIRRVGDAAIASSSGDSSLADTIPARFAIDHIALEDIPTIDGDLADWETLFGPPHLTQRHFISTTGAILGSVPEQDQKVEAWLGWNDQTNLIYIAGRVTDDVFATNTYGDEPAWICRSDAMEVYVDADHSGGYYDWNYCHAQQYVLNPAGTQGAVLYPLILTDPPEVQAAARRNGTVYTYEWAVPGWESISSNGTGVRHDFQADQIIGLTIVFPDFESREDADSRNYHAFNGLNGPVGAYRDADQFTDFRLIAPVEEWPGLEPLPPELDLVGAIAFESDRDGHRGIYLMNADGTSPFRLTPDPSQNLFPAWSPDGQEIAFESDRSGSWEIFRMAIDDRRSIVLTETDPGRQATWSPDGQKIAFESERDGNWEIYVVDADGSNLANLTRHPAEDRFPAWSPDGQKIAFDSDRDDELPEVYLMDADGSHVVRLTRDSHRDGLPAWSPDGRMIAFQTERDGFPEVYVMAADGANPINLTHHPARDGLPTWSPDGRKIAFHTNRDGNWEIYVMDADGSDPVNLTHHPADDTSPDWSPLARTPLPAMVPGDFDGSGQVNFADFFLFANRFGAAAGEAGYEDRYDLDGSGRIYFADLFLFADYFEAGEREKLIALAEEYFGLPVTPRLEPNFPNPFNASTTLRYQLSEPGRVRLEIFDLAGQRIRFLTHEQQGPGVFQIRWDGTDERGQRVSTGIYLARLQAGEFSGMVKMLLVK